MRHATVSAASGAAATLVLALAVARPASADVSVTYTVDADFDLGQAHRVTHEPVHDQLGIIPDITSRPYVWVAASRRGTAVKIDIATGDVLGEYLTAPSGLTDEGIDGRNPSRTSVDLDGNVWLGNRSSFRVTGIVGEDGRAYVGEDGSVVKIGVAEAGSCVDRNGNGVIDTSTGLGDVRAWSNPAGVDTLGGVQSAEDECIIVFKRVDPTRIRLVALDSRGDVWVGGDAQPDAPEKKVQLLDGDTGDVLRTIDLQSPTDTGEPAPLCSSAGPYGGVVDCAGTLWVATHSDNLLLRIDPSKPNGHPDLVLPIDIAHRFSFSYGLGLDTDGSVWHSTYGANDLMKFDSAGNLVSGPHPTTGGNARGLAVTPADRNVWVANTSTQAVTRHLPNGAVASVVGVGQQPTGVAVDSAGKVWVSCFVSGEAMRIDPATDTVDLSVDLDMPGHPYGEDAGPYNYSDMTGTVGARTFRNGSWRVVTEGECDGYRWTSAAWSSVEPAGTRLAVSVRAADDPADLATSPWTTAGNGVPLDSQVGRHVEIRVEFLVEPGSECTPGTSPVLLDLTVTGTDAVAPTVECPADVRLACGDEDVVPPTAIEDCSAAVLTMVETIESAPCPLVRTVVREWTATDDAGNTSTCVQRIEVEDVSAPVLAPEPPDDVAECGEDPALPAVSAIDDCGAPPVALVESRVPGPCAGAEVLTRTWTAVDSCGHVGSIDQVITILDTTPPEISAAPPDITVDCAAPAPATPTATDCSGSVPVTLTETRVPVGCEVTLTRTWTAVDPCGNAASTSQVIVIRDLPAELQGVPADATVECGVPEVPAVTAVDCEGPVPVVFAEEVVPGDCPGESTILRTWMATDACLNVTTMRQSISVADSTPPRIEAIRAPGCIWPPNHKYLCFTDLGSLVDASDSCPGGLTVTATGCRSDQPDDQQGSEDRGINGDGNTEDDCVVADDGSGFCVRSERLGQCLEGRTYGVSLKVTDGCGNAAFAEAELWVPHDQREHPECVPLPRPHEFLAPHEELPFAWTPRSDPDAGLPHPFVCPVTGRAGHEGPIRPRR